MVSFHSRSWLALFPPPLPRPVPSPLQLHVRHLWLGIEWMLFQCWMNKKKKKKKCLFKWMLIFIISKRSLISLRIHSSSQFKILKSSSKWNERSNLIQFPITIETHIVSPLKNSGSPIFINDGWSAFNVWSFSFFLILIIILMLQQLTLPHSLENPLINHPFLPFLGSISTEWIQKQIKRTQRCEFELSL